MSEPIRKYSEDEVLCHIREIWPGMGDAVRYVLWHHSGFPFFDGDDPLKYWIDQIEEYMKDNRQLWQTLHG